jgi:hypothetical protein
LVTLAHSSSFSEPPVFYFCIFAFCILQARAGEVLITAELHEALRHTALLRPPPDRPPSPSKVVRSRHEVRKERAAAEARAELQQFAAALDFEPGAYLSNPEDPLSVVDYVAVSLANGALGWWREFFLKKIKDLKKNIGTDT